MLHVVENHYVYKHSFIEGLKKKPMFCFMVAE